jgi:uncharacterized protein YodC (DUF2158 family)
MKVIHLFSEGILVRQKCGGPTMWIVTVDEAYPCSDGTLGGLFCTWEDRGVLYEHVFSPFALDIVGPPSVAPDGAERRAHRR